MLSPVPRVVVIGSGLYAMAIINSFKDVVELKRLEIFWILPSEIQEATLFNGHGWSRAASVKFDPQLTSLIVCGILQGKIDKIVEGACGRIVYCAGKAIACNAVIVALEPFHDMMDESDNFLVQYSRWRPAEESHYLRNTSTVELNMLCDWQMESLSLLLNQNVHRKFIQSSIQSSKVPERTKSKVKEDDDEEAVDDDDDMEFDRPTVLHFVLPRVSSQFAETLMRSSDSNCAEVLYFAMNDGERSLDLAHKHLGDAEIERVCSALRHHYLTIRDGNAVLLRDVNAIDLEDNNITSLSPLTQTFFWSSSNLPVTSMIKVLTLSNNPLQKHTLMALLKGLASSTDVHLSTLRLSNCGLDDEVGEMLSTVVGKMKSLETLDISRNKFCSSTSASILLTSRHNIRMLVMNGICLEECEGHISKLLFGNTIESLDISECNLKDNAALAIGEALVKSPSRGRLRTLNVSNNRSISTAGVRFLFECLCTFQNNPSSLTQFYAKGCGPLGIHEISFVAFAMHACKRLSCLSFSLIESEQLCLQVVVDSVLSGAHALVELDYDMCAVPSRCDASLSVETHITLPKSITDALTQRLASNKAKNETRQEEIAGRSMRTSTVVEVAADAARSVAQRDTSSTVPLHYIRIDDSLTREVYSSQMTAPEMDEYRYRRWEEAIRAVGADFGAACAGFKCGTVDTIDPQWNFFCDATVVMKPPRIPQFLRRLPSVTIDDEAVVVDEFNMVNRDMNVAMIGCGAKRLLGDAPFALGVNGGVSWSFLASIQIPSLRQELIASLCKDLAVVIPQTDAVNEVLRGRDISMHVLRQKLLELLSLQYTPIESFIEQKSIKYTLEEVCRRIAEARPDPYVSLLDRVKDESALRLQMESVGSSLQLAIAAPTVEAKSAPAPPPKKSDGKTVDKQEAKKDAQPPVVAPATVVPVLPQPSRRDTRNVIVDCLKSTNFIGM